MKMLSFGTICLVVLSSCVLVSSNPVFGVGKSARKGQIHFQPSNLYVKCATSEYSSRELDLAAKEACTRFLTKNKLLRNPLARIPKIYNGPLLVTYNADASNSRNVDQATHFYRFQQQTILTWPLKYKFRHLKAKCEVVVEWSSEQLQCRVLGALIKETGMQERRCNQIGFRDPNSQHGGSYHPGSPGLSFYPSPGPSYPASPDRSFHRGSGPS